MISVSRLIYDGLWSEADPRNLCYLICRHPLYNCPPSDHVSTQGQGTALPPHSSNSCDHGQSSGILLISAMHDSLVKISTIWNMYQKVWICVCALKSPVAEWLWVMVTFLTSSIIDIPVSLWWPFLQHDIDQHLFSTWNHNFIVLQWIMSHPSIQYLSIIALPLQCFSLRICHDIIKWIIYYWRKCYSTLTLSISLSFTIKIIWIFSRFL